MTSPADNEAELRRGRLRELDEKRPAGAPAVPTVAEAGPPVFWPKVTGLEATARWTELSEWVEVLRDTYEDVDLHVVPLCWYRHPAIVRALQALKDHERGSYAAGSPPLAGTDWHRAYRDITNLLRHFVSRLKCEAQHVDEKAPAWQQGEQLDERTRDFTEFVTADAKARRSKALQSAASNE
jgi:hypothetical protein